MIFMKIYQESVHPRSRVRTWRKVFATARWMRAVTKSVSTTRQKGTGPASQYLPTETSYSDKVITEYAE